MASTPHRILLVEDNLPLARVYREYLREEPYEVSHVASGGEAFVAIESDKPDALVLDLQLPDMNGIEILREVRTRKLPISVVVITAHGSINGAVEAMRVGAFDFLVKPFTAERLKFTLRNALERLLLSRLVESYREAIDRRHYFGFIGSALPMQAIYRTIDSAAASKATVFITGESGTGKEVCADALHRRSQRAERPFVALNCAAIPKELMESEIFGHVKGAFTGAVGTREGAAARADQGTLFLDEVCEMPLDLQAKLLRFVQTGTFNKVGSGTTEQVDVRFVCATNKDPLRETMEGRFREDLYYRLHVIPIHMPALRERGGDVVDLARHFLLDAVREEGKHFTAFGPDAEAAIAAYEWPGNVRQLQNVIRNVVVLNDGDIVSADMLPDLIRRHAPALVHPQLAVAPRQAVAVLATPELVALPARAVSTAVRPLAVVEREAIEAALRVTDGNVPRAAALLEISPSTVYRKLTRWDSGTEE